MKRSLMIMLLVGFSLFSSNYFAQAKGEKMKELRTAFINEELSLTEAEQAKFWPIYETRKEAKKASRKASKAIKDYVGPNMSEKELQEASEKLKALKVQDVEAEHNYMMEILPILGVQRTLDLRKIEKRFKERMKGHREGKGGKGHGGHDNHDGHDH